MSTMSDARIIDTLRAGWSFGGYFRATDVRAALSPLRPATKRFIDIAIAGTMLATLALPMAVIAFLVRLDGGPAFFSHSRVGRGGRLFGCLKFRTMQVDAEQRLHQLIEQDADARAEWFATRKLRNDPRITRIGRFLRSTSLDELPQLLNVLRGEMSLVGPRPVTPSELAANYGAAADHYQLVRPGITGPWQVSGRNDVSYDRRVALDVAYATRPSLLLDLRLLVQTPIVVLLRRGAY
jgi:lipopolysaccharide/colanic/teichoic acid biosynthesis glycosyltransferase